MKTPREISEQIIAECVTSLGNIEATEHALLSSKIAVAIEERDQEWAAVVAENAHAFNALTPHSVANTVASLEKSLTYWRDQTERLREELKAKPPARAAISAKELLPKFEEMTAWQVEFNLNGDYTVEPTAIDALKYIQQYVKEKLE